MSFKDLNLPEPILRAIEKMEFTEPTEVQKKCIPILMSGVDVIGRSQTGSGKTLAFGIPMLSKIDPDFNGVQAIIICPTRELAMQVCDEIRKIAYFQYGCKSVPLCGGCNFEKQLMSLKRGARIVVGTPGRIQDHIRRGTLNLSTVKIAILDEADEMMSMGFITDMETILAECNADRQTIMFSATMPKQILELTKKFMKDPTLIEIGENNKPIENINQNYVYVNKADKRDTLFSILKNEKPDLSIIFCNTKKMVDVVYKILGDGGYNAAAIHGDMPQSSRKRVMTAIKNGDSKILIATDVAARGIDINDVDLVINYDIPNDLDYYIHRIGRTGRAGKDGKAITIIADKFEYSQLMELQVLTKTTLNEYVNEFSKPIKPTVEPGQYEKRPDSRGGRPSSNGRGGQRSGGDRNSFGRGDRSSSFGDNRRFGNDRRSSFGETKSFERPSNDDFTLNDGNSEGDFENRPAREERKPFERRESSSFGERKPFPRREGSSFGERKPFNRDGASGEKREFSGERKPFPRREGSSFGERKPFNRDGASGEKREFSGERKPFPRREGSSFGERKPFNRDGASGEKREFSGERKPFPRREGSSFGERKPFNRDGASGEKREFSGERKPFSGSRSFTRSDNKFGGDDRPKRDFKRKP